MFKCWCGYYVASIGSCPRCNTFKVFTQAGERHGPVVVVKMADGKRREV
mgnify:CR=1 FL=1